MYNYYNINMQKLGRWIIPIRLRFALFIAFKDAGYTPLVNLYNKFISYRTAKIYDLSMNYQVCYLEAFLNDRFDFTQRRIYIDEAQTLPGTFLYKRDELKPLVVKTRSEAAPIIIRMRGETGGNLAFDFIIYIPLSITVDYQELKAMVATKLCGKRYGTQRF